MDINRQQEAYCPEVNIRPQRPTAPKCLTSTSIHRFKQAVTSKSAAFLLMALFASNLAQAIVFEWNDKADQTALWNLADNWKNKGVSVPNSTDDEVKFKKIKNDSIIDLEGGTYTISKLKSEADKDYTLTNGTLISAGDFEFKKKGTATLDITRLGGGTTTVKDKDTTVIIANQDALGTGNLILSKGTISSGFAELTINNTLVINEGGVIGGEYDITIGGSIISDKTKGDLKIENTGVTTFSGTNTFSQKTVVKEGTLVIEGSHAGEVKVEKDGILEGMGIIFGETEIKGTLNLTSGLTFENSVKLDKDSTITLTLGASDLGELFAGLGSNVTGIDKTTLELIIGEDYKQGIAISIFANTDLDLSSFKELSFFDSVGNSINLNDVNYSETDNGIDIVPEFKHFSMSMGLCALLFVMNRRRR